MPSVPRRATPARAERLPAPAVPILGAPSPYLGLLLYSAPLWSGVVGRLLRGGVWFPDYGALVCGAERVGGGLYDPAMSCSDPNAAAFVYGPWIARLTARLIGVLGGQGLFVAYLGAFALAAGFLVWLLVARRATPGEPHERTRFLGFVIGSAISTGNIALPLHAAVAAAGLLLARAPWLFVAAVAAAGAVKPVFLTYLAVIVLMRRSLAWRAVAVTTGALASLAPTIAFALHGGAEFDAWRARLSHFVYQVTPGDGLFGWMGLMGLPADGLAGALAALAWAGAVTLCGLAVAARGRLGGEGRLWLGFACAVLANPRLMSEDVFLLGPGLLAAAGAVGAWRPDAGRWAGQAIAAACGLALVGNLVDLSDLATPIATLVLAAVLAGLGLITLSRRADAA